MSEVVLKQKMFTNRQQADEWAKDQKKKLSGSHGVVRHTISEVLNHPEYKWEVTLYVR